MRGSMLARLVGFLVCVELASGVLQGYYTPILSDLSHHLQVTDADLNWLEGAQLTVSALAVPVLARLGDLLGHKQVLLASTAVTALASWGLAFAPNFWTFLIAWALQGFYAVWLPLEIAIIHGRTNGDAGRTRLGAGVLVAALEIGVILGAVAAGALISGLPMTVVLMGPAIVVTLCLPVILRGVPDTPARSPGRIDWPGFAVLTFCLLAVMGALALVRSLGLGSAWPWLLLVVGALAAVSLVRVERTAADPLIDFPVLRARRQWPLQAAAALFGASVLGAQIPLSTFARTDPQVHGYGLGASASEVSLLIAAYVLAMAAGAASMPWVAARIGPQAAMGVAAALVGVGYLAFIPRHDALTDLLLNMIVIGLGSGALVAALPAAAADAAPPERTGFVTGMTNTTKTIGGALASCVYGIALAGNASEGASLDAASTGSAALENYFVVWGVAGGTAVLAALLLVTTNSGRVRVSR